MKSNTALGDKFVFIYGSFIKKDTCYTKARPDNERTGDE
jgi:hypothetical protein